MDAESYWINHHTNSDELQFAVVEVGGSESLGVLALALLDGEIFGVYG